VLDGVRRHQRQVTNQLGRQRGHGLHVGVDITALYRDILAELGCLAELPRVIQPAANYGLFFLDTEPLVSGARPLITRLATILAPPCISVRLSKSLFRVRCYGNICTPSVVVSRCNGEVRMVSRIGWMSCCLLLIGGTIESLDHNQRRVLASYESWYLLRYPERQDSFSAWQQDEFDRWYAEEGVETMGLLRSASLGIDWEEFALILAPYTGVFVGCAVLAVMMPHRRRRGLLLMAVPPAVLIVFALLLTAKTTVA